MVTSAAFVGMAASVQPEDVAIAGNGMYLFLNIGAIAGASSGAAALSEHTSIWAEGIF